MIDILVPVLGRPQNAQPLVDSITAATTVPHRVLFLCSPGDEAQIQECMRTGAEVIVVSFPCADSDYPKKMNVGLRETEAPFLLLGADDLTFDPGWDAALDAPGEEGVIGTNDCLNPQFRDGSNSTHPIVRRSYVEILGGSADGPGTIFHEGYDHNFCERELSGLAQQRGLYRYVPESRLRHRHPHWRTAPLDATYEKGMQGFARDQQVFFSRAHLWGYKGLSLHERRAAQKLRYTETQ